MVKRILITGGAGFVGGNLAQRFARAGHHVRVLDNLSPQVHGPDPRRTSATFGLLDGFAEFIHGSVTNDDDLLRALEGVEVVVHLAAETGTGQSMYEIGRYVRVNVGGTARLLDALGTIDHSVQRLVVASSRAIYGEGAYQKPDGHVCYPSSRQSDDMSIGNFAVRSPDGDQLTCVATTEDAPSQPSSVYGITKYAQEALVMAVAPAQGIEPVALRYQNIYGPGQSLKNPYTGILSIFSTLIRQGREINIFEDGLESRDFVYIDDAVEATFLAATAPAAAGQTINIGSGVSTSVNDVVSLLMQAFQTTVPVRISGDYRIGDIRHNVADISRASARLGFVPTVPFSEGLKRFAQWVSRQPLENTTYTESLDEMAARGLLKPSHS